MKKRISFCFGVLLLVSFYASTNAIQVSGDIWGVWNPSNNPYEVIGNLHVPRDSSLTIMPGCSIQFQGHYKMQIDSLATLTAVGTAQDSIYFFPTDTVNGWSGLSLYYTDTTTKISYCSFNYRIWSPADPPFTGTINFEGIDFTITHCGFSNNYTVLPGGVLRIQYGTARSSIYDCLFTNNGYRDSLSWQGCVLYLQATNNFVSNCYFEHNNGGVIMINLGGKVVNCVFKDNTGTPLATEECTGLEVISNLFINNWDISYPGILSTDAATIINNTFYNNTCVACHGVFVQSGEAYYGTVSLLNNIFWGDSVTPQIRIDEGRLGAWYNDIRGGWPSTGNIDSNPMFVDTANGDFHLQAGSPCIDAGDPLSPLDPDWTRADMGALPFDHIYTVYIPGDISGDGQRLGADVTYGVRYFKGWSTPPPDSVYNDSTGTWVYAAADVNGDCEFRGADITYLVGYFKGINPVLKWCPQTPPF